MDTYLIATTLQRDLVPLGKPGERSYELLVETLRQNGFLVRETALFAEPIPPPDGSTVDWYTSLGGDAHPWDEVRAASNGAAERLESLDRRIEDLAEKLEQSPREQDRA